MRHMFSDKQLTAKTIADVNKAIEDGQISAGSAIHMYRIKFKYSSNTYYFEYETNTELVTSSAAEALASFIADLDAKGYTSNSVYLDIMTKQYSSGNNLFEFIGLFKDGTTLSGILETISFTISESSIVITSGVGYKSITSTGFEIVKKF